MFSDINLDSEAEFAQTRSRHSTKHTTGQVWETMMQLDLACCLL